MLEAGPLLGGNCLSGRTKVGTGTFAEIGDPPPPKTRSPLDLHTPLANFVVRFEGMAVVSRNPRVSQYFARPIPIPTEKGHRPRVN
jgi:hypothetical protein